MAFAEFAKNNAINVATGYNPFFLNSSDPTLAPLVFMHGRGVSSPIETMQPMVYQMKTTLEEA